MIHHDKEYAVKEKRFDILERKWKYILEPLEELKLVEFSRFKLEQLGMLCREGKTTRPSSPG